MNGIYDELSVPYSVMYEMSKRQIENNFGISPAEKYLVDIVISNLNGMNVVNGNQNEREYIVYTTNTKDDGSKDLGVMAIILPDQNRLIFTHNTQSPFIIQSNPPEKLFHYINFHVMDELNRRGQLEALTKEGATE